VNQRSHGAPASAGARGADPFDVALAAIRAQRAEALSTLDTIEAAITRARTLPRDEAVRVIDAAGSLEHELGLAETDCACDILLEEAFGDLHDPQDAVIDLDEALVMLGGRP
jgi:hypothetical protein